MAEAWIKGKSAPLEAAGGEAARLLSASKLPVIAGLGADVAGVRAAIALAERLGGVIDHMHSAALLRNLDVMREAGMMMTTPGEARVRADLLLLVGPGVIATWPELPTCLFVRSTQHGGGARKRVIWLCPGSAVEDLGSAFEIETIGRDPAELPVLLAVLRARCAGRPVSATGVDSHTLDSVIAALAQARFGVAVWSAADHDALTIEMLCGLVKDLNAATRFSTLPLAPSDNAAAVQQVSGWMTGFPLRTGFGRIYPEHDPWRFDARRLVESGEADCGLWVSAYRAVAPPWRRDVPLIVLTGAADALSYTPEVAIAVGRPGIDHDAVEHRPDTRTLAWVEARAASGALSVADAVTRIAAALPVAPC